MDIMIHLLSIIGLFNIVTPRPGGDQPILAARRRSLTSFPVESESSLDNTIHNGRSSMLRRTGSDKESEFTDDDAYEVRTEDGLKEIIQTLVLLNPDRAHETVQLKDSPGTLSEALSTDRAHLERVTRKKPDLRLMKESAPWAHHPVTAQVKDDSKKETRERREVRKGAPGVVGRQKFAYGKTGNSNRRIRITTLAEISPAAPKHPMNNTEVGLGHTIKRNVSFDAATEKSKDFEKTNVMREFKFNAKREQGTAFKKGKMNHSHKGAIASRIQRRTRQMSGRKRSSNIPTERIHNEEVKWKSTESTNDGKLSANKSDPRKTAQVKDGASSLNLSRSGSPSPGELNKGKHEEKKSRGELQKQYDVPKHHIFMRKKSSQEHSNFQVKVRLSEKTNLKPEHAMWTLHPRGQNSKALFIKRHRTPTVLKYKEDKRERQANMAIDGSAPSVRKKSEIEASPFSHFPEADAQPTRIIQKRTDIECYNEIWSRLGKLKKFQDGYVMMLYNILAKFDTSNVPISPDVASMKSQYIKDLSKFMDDLAVEASKGCDASKTPDSTLLGSATIDTDNSPIKTSEDRSYWSEQNTVLPPDTNAATQQSTSDEPIEKQETPSVLPYWTEAQGGPVESPSSPTMYNGSKWVVTMSKTGPQYPIALNIFQDPQSANQQNSTDVTPTSDQSSPEPGPVSLNPAQNLPKTELSDNIKTNYGDNRDFSPRSDISSLNRDNTGPGRPGKVNDLFATEADARTVQADVLRDDVSSKETSSEPVIDTFSSKDTELSSLHQEFEVKNVDNDGDQLLVSRDLGSSKDNNLNQKINVTPLKDTDGSSQIRSPSSYFDIRASYDRVASAYNDLVNVYNRNSDPSVSYLIPYYSKIYDDAQNEYTNVLERDDVQSAQTTQENAERNESGVSRNHIEKNIGSQTIPDANKTFNYTEGDGSIPFKDDKSLFAVADRTPNSPQGCVQTISPSLNSVNGKNQNQDEVQEEKSGSAVMQNTSYSEQFTVGTSMKNPPGNEENHSKSPVVQQVMNVYLPIVQASNPSTMNPSELQETTAVTTENNASPQKNTGPQYIPPANQISASIPVYKTNISTESPSSTIPDVYTPNAVKGVDAWSTQGMAQTTSNTNEKARDVSPIVPSSSTTFNATPGFEPVLSSSPAATQGQLSGTMPQSAQTFSTHLDETLLVMTQLGTMQISVPPNSQPQALQAPDTTSSTTSNPASSESILHTGPMLIEPSLSSHRFFDVPYMSEKTGVEPLYVDQTHTSNSSPGGHSESFPNTKLPVQNFDGTGKVLDVVPSYQGNLAVGPSLELAISGILYPVVSADLLKNSGPINDVINSTQGPISHKVVESFSGQSTGISTNPYMEQPLNQIPAPFNAQMANIPVEGQTFDMRLMPEQSPDGHKVSGQPLNPIPTPFSGQIINITSVSGSISSIQQTPEQGHHLAPSVSVQLLDPILASSSGQTVNVSSYPGPSPSTQVNPAQSFGVAPAPFQSIQLSAPSSLGQIKTNDDSKEEFSQPFSPRPLINTNSPFRQVSVSTSSPDSGSQQNPSINTPTSEAQTIRVTSNPGQKIGLNAPAGTGPRQNSAYGPETTLGLPCDSKQTGSQYGEVSQGQPEVVLSNLEKDPKVYLNQNQALCSPTVPSPQTPVNRSENALKTDKAFSSGNVSHNVVSDLSPARYRPVPMGSADIPSSYRPNGSYTDPSLKNMTKNEENTSSEVTMQKPSVDFKTSGGSEQNYVPDIQMIPEHILNPNETPTSIAYQDGLNGSIFDEEVYNRLKNKILNTSSEVTDSIPDQKLNHGAPPKSPQDSKNASLSKLSDRTSQSGPTIMTIYPQPNFTKNISVGIVEISTAQQKKGEKENSSTSPDTLPRTAAANDPVRIAYSAFIPIPVGDIGWNDGKSQEELTDRNRTRPRAVGNSMSTKTDGNQFLTKFSSDTSTVSKSKSTTIGSKNSVTNIGVFTDLDSSLYSLKERWTPSQNAFSSGKTGTLSGLDENNAEVQSEISSHNPVDGESSFEGDSERPASPAQQTAVELSLSTSASNSFGGAQADEGGVSVSVLPSLANDLSTIPSASEHNEVSEGGIPTASSLLKAMTVASEDHQHLVTSGKRNEVHLRPSETETSTDEDAATGTSSELSNDKEDITSISMMKNEGEKKSAAMHEDTEGSTVGNRIVSSGVESSSNGELSGGG